MIDYVFNESGFQAYKYAFSSGLKHTDTNSLFTFVCIDSDFCRFSIEQEEFIVKKGQIIFIPLDTPHSIEYISERQEKRCYGRIIHVRFFAGVNRWDYPPQVITPNKETIKALNDLPIDNYEPITKDCNFMRRFFYFLEIVQSCMVKSNKKFTEIIEKAIKYMYDNVECSVGDVAKHCAISESYLFKIFEKNVLCSPAKFKQKIRAEKGEELLRETDLSIDEIAALVGFSSPTQFRTVFNSRFHTSPSKFRKNYKTNK